MLAGARRWISVYGCMANSAGVARIGRFASNVKERIIREREARLNKTESILPVGTREGRLALT